MRLAVPLIPVWRWPANSIFLKCIEVHIFYLTISISLDSVKKINSL